MSSLFGIECAQVTGATRIIVTPAASGARVEPVGEARCVAENVFEFPHGAEMRLRYTAPTGESQVLFLGQSALNAAMLSGTTR